MANRKFVAVVLALLIVAGVSFLVPRTVHAVCPTCPPPPPGGGGGGKERKRRPTPTDTRVPTPTSTLAPAILPALINTATSIPWLLPDEPGQTSPVGVTGLGQDQHQPLSNGPRGFNLPEPLSGIIAFVLLAGLVIGFVLPAIRGRLVPAAGSSPHVYDGSDRMGAQPHMDDGSGKPDSWSIGNPDLAPGSPSETVPGPPDLGELPASIGNPDLNPGDALEFNPQPDIPGMVGHDLNPGDALEFNPQPDIPGSEAMPGVGPGDPGDISALKPGGGDPGDISALKPGGGNPGDPSAMVPGNPDLPGSS